MAIALPRIQATTCRDHDLVAAIRRGDDTAFAELFSRHRPRVTAYIAGMVGDQARAEDLAQEVFISALRRLRATERPIAFKPWIFEIAKNACIDDFRRRQRTHEVPLEDDDDPARMERLLYSRHPTPEVAIESKQRLADLRGAFHGLSEQHHRVLVMRELEGLSYDQIAERMGMSRAMVESTLFRARKKLSEEYEDLVSGRRCEQVRALVDGSELSSARVLGVRHRRRIARHLSHCQPCRRYARAAGMDDSLFKAPVSIGAKIAAVLPIPWLRWRRSGGPKAGGGGSRSFLLARGAQGLAEYGDSVPAMALGRAAAAAVAVAVATVAGGLPGASHSAAHATTISPTAAAVTHVSPSPTSPRVTHPVVPARLTAASRPTAHRHSRTIPAKPRFGKPSPAARRGHRASKRAPGAATRPKPRPSSANNTPTTSSSSAAPSGHGGLGAKLPKLPQHHIVQGAAGAAVGAASAIAGSAEGVVSGATSQVAQPVAPVVGQVTGQTVQTVTGAASEAAGALKNGQSTVSGAASSVTGALSGNAG
jgi:RNA polymerase sigma factor (sigma-70 family)